MSFTETVKEELCAFTYETRCCKRAHLAGLVGFSGTVQTEQGEWVLKLRTENAAIAGRAVALLEDLFGISALIVAVGKICNITVSENTELVLKQLGYISGGMIKFSVDPFVVHDECCKTAFLAGAFLGGGYVKTDRKSVV